MSDKSAIEWTDASWNPIIGCSILSPGCTNCYAMKQAARIQKMNPTGGSGSQYVNHYDGTTHVVNGNVVWTGKVALAPDKLFLKPLAWREPRKVFVNSMGDLFHESIPDEWIDRVFAVMALCPQHTFQVLTKRAERLEEYFDRRAILGRGGLPYEWRNAAEQITGEYQPEPLFPLPNVWLGVSAERQQEWDERKEYLRYAPAVVRFASFEPLVGPVKEEMPLSLYIDWSIAGGESGACARPMHPRWARDIRDQCQAADVPFFFKQWGEWLPCAGDEQLAYAKSLRSRAENHDVAWPDGTVGCGNADQNGGYGKPLLRVGKKAAGRLLDGREWNEFPATKQTAAA